MTQLDIPAAQKEKRLRISEAFYSIEGEGPMTGLPTVFVRTFGCNFTCSGFSNPTGQAVIPIQIEKLEKFKPTMGCDSIYSWHPSYKELSNWYTITELAEHIVNGLLKGNVRNANSGKAPILSLTGGEPTMHQDAIAALIHHPMMVDFDMLLIETNAAYPLKQSFLDSLNEWQRRGDRSVIWSCSPKLSLSGEKREDAIRPEIIEQQMTLDAGAMHYLKFVSDGSRESFDEIVETVKVYNEHLMSVEQNISGHMVYVMPVGATSEQQSQVQRQVADMCLEYGFSFCIRAHCFVYNNEVGT